MNYRKYLLYGLLAVLIVAGAGCARAAKDTTGFALENTITVKAPFEETWQAVKSVLREQDMDLYTRDKRGTFVAYGKMHRRWLQPTRTKYTVEVGRVSANETRVFIETIKQVYGVTLLTYPDWHDRKAKDNGAAAAILDAVQAKLSGTPESGAAKPAEEAAKN